MMLLTTSFGDAVKTPFWDLDLPDFAVDLDFTDLGAFYASLSSVSCESALGSTSTALSWLVFASDIASADFSYSSS